MRLYIGYIHNNVFTQRRTQYWLVQSLWQAERAHTHIHLGGCILVYTHNTLTLEYALEVSIIIQYVLL